MRELLKDTTKAALVIIDKFKGQITTSINSLLEGNNINVCLIPANTTDLLQPMDLAVNKPAKDFLKRKFEEWYSGEVTKQLNGVIDIQSTEIQPVDLSFCAMKLLPSKWLVEMAEYLLDNPQFVVNGFRRAGILAALDCNDEDEDLDGNDEEKNLEEESEEEDYQYDDDDDDTVTLSDSE